MCGGVLEDYASIGDMGLSPQLAKTTDKRSVPLTFKHLQLNWIKHIVMCLKQRTKTGNTHSLKGVLFF
jgi:hypothetical protein